MQTQTNACACGCGTPIPTITKQGKPQRFAHGHNRRGQVGKRLTAEQWREEDRGYETPCWIWLLAKSRGYGRVRVAGKKHRAHRFFWERHHGPVPVGLELDHLCKQRDCVNPGHLEAVTHAVNCRRSATLTAEQVEQIRSAMGSLSEIAHRFGTSKQHVWRIRKGYSW